MDTYRIYEGFMDDLKKKVATIEKKCKKYGCEFHFAEVGEEFAEVEIPNTWDEEKKTRKTKVCRFVIVEAEGTAVLNGWELVAYVENTEVGNILHKVNTEVEIPERYRNGDRYCEHCHTRRRRKQVCIVRNVETNEFKQVGSTCLKDFTRGMSASVVAMMAEFRDIFATAESAPLGGNGWRCKEYHEVEELLRYTAETIRLFGYKKSEDEYPTRQEAREFYDYDRGEYDDVFCKEIRRKISEKKAKSGFNPQSESAKEMVEKALAWIKEQEASNDYMHNLKVATSLKYIDLRNMGLLVSLFPTWNKALEREAEQRLREEQMKAERKSNWVGEVGKRITVAVENGSVVTSWENCFDGYHYTTTYMYKFIDAEGNVIIWKTSTRIDEEEVTQITGTVKEHREFREVKQTVLTRCKVAC